MFRKNHSLLFLPSFLFVGLLIAGCGGNIKTTTPNPTGFSNADLNGTYAFAISGNDGGGFFAIAGSFNANGSGVITGGTEDINDPGAGGVAKNVAITGTYAVRTDGRTVATITSTSPAFKFVVDFVLLSGQKGLVIEFDQSGSASGTIDMQTTSAANLASLAGSFAF